MVRHFSTTMAVAARASASISKSVSKAVPESTVPVALKKELPTQWSVKRVVVSGWLPVYRDYRRSHNQIKETIIRRIIGNPQLLLQDLTADLKIEGKVNLRSGNIHLKGDQLGDRMGKEDAQNAFGLAAGLFGVGVATGSSSAYAAGYLVLGVAAGLLLLESAQTLAPAETTQTQTQTQMLIQTEKQTAAELQAHFDAVRFGSSVDAFDTADQLNEQQQQLQQQQQHEANTPIVPPPRRSHTRDLLAQRQSEARRRRRVEVSQLLRQLERRVSTASMSTSSPLPSPTPMPANSGANVATITTNSIETAIHLETVNTEITPLSETSAGDLESIATSPVASTASTSQSPQPPRLGVFIPSSSSPSSSSSPLIVSATPNLTPQRTHNHNDVSSPVSSPVSPSSLVLPVPPVPVPAPSIAVHPDDMESDSTNLPIDIDKLLSELDQALAGTNLNNEDDSDEEENDNEDNIFNTDSRFLENVTECKNLVSLLYSISEDQAKKDGFVHRGVTCNHCGAQPIRGIRYHCLNCPDYDLCDSCENLGDVHTKTHAFIKIRIPLAPHANLRGTGAPVMYPGKEIVTWNRDEEVQKLVNISHFEAVEIQALFEQFLSLATIPPTADGPGGITRETFDQCLGALGKEKNLITDRIFSFFDQDADECISFKEFVLGLGVMIKGSLDERIENAFKGYDLNNDGQISRQELHQMFKAYFYLSMQLVRDFVKTVEQEMMDTFDDEAAKPVSASFTAPIPSAGGGVQGDEDQTHLKIRGNEGTIGDDNNGGGNTSLHINTVPTSNNDSGVNISSSSSSKPPIMSAVSANPFAARLSITSAGSVASASIASPSQVFSPVRNNSSSSTTSIGAPPQTNFSSSILTPAPSSSGLAIDVGYGKTMKGKLPSTIHETSEDYYNPYHNNGGIGGSAGGSNSNMVSAPPPPRRSASPTGSITSARSVSPTYMTPTAMLLPPNVGRLSGTISTTTTTTTVGGGLLTRGTRALQEVQALRRRSNVSLRGMYRDGGNGSGSIGASGAVFASANNVDGSGWQSPVSPFEDLLLGSAGSGGLFVAGAAVEEQQLPVIEAMSQDAIEEMVERT
ncbi:hypothetical protein HK100_009089 [Physocladia obscura]|uniref:Calmodulin n=1 Tax=Physocladia obscura TaxID=109957 RepID=A0AAD5XED3_9FUNG|nr:hypothetical protein HK100_009089 [Physocladia obscura]